MAAEEVEYESDIASDTFEVYAAKASKCKRLTPQHQNGLIALAQAGNEEALEELILSNFGLVLKVARKYLYTGVPLMDLIQEGNIGLMHAISRFKESFGCRLSTIAQDWIKQQIQRAVANQEVPIRIPVHLGEEATRVWWFKRNWEEKYPDGPNPTDEQICKGTRITPAKLKTINSLPKISTSLNIPTHGGSGDPTDTEVGDFIEDTGAKPDDLAEISELQQRVREVVGKLTSVQRTVIEGRYGLNLEGKLTLDVIGKRLKISRERACQIEAVAMKRLEVLIRQRKYPVISEEFKNKFFDKKISLEPEKSIKKSTGRPLFHGGKALLVRVEAAMVAGMTIREVSRVCDISTATAMKMKHYFEEKSGKKFLCECLKDLGHKGWCKNRFQKSPARQAVMDKIHKSEKVEPAA